MSETQRYHVKLTEQEPAKLSGDVLDEFLLDVTSGTKNFGRFEEWDSWFLYLLPDLILRNYESVYSPLLEITVSALMNIYWSDIERPYPEFYNDVMNTIGLCLMTPPWWEKQGLAEYVGLHSVSVSLFFCLKFLPAEEIPDWTASLAGLQGKYWKIWFAQWWRLFTQFCEAALENEGHFQVVVWLESLRLGWGNAELLIPTNSLFDFIPRANIELFLDELKMYHL